MLRILVVELVHFQLSVSSTAIERYPNLRGISTTCTLVLVCPTARPHRLSHLLRQSHNQLPRLEVHSRRHPRLLTTHLLLRQSRTVEAAVVAAEESRTFHQTTSLTNRNKRKSTASLAFWYWLVSLVVRCMCTRSVAPNFSLYDIDEPVTTVETAICTADFRWRALRTLNRRRFLRLLRLWMVTSHNGKIVRCVDNVFSASMNWHAITY